MFFTVSQVSVEGEFINFICRGHSGKDYRDSSVFYLMKQEKIVSPPMTVLSITEPEEGGTRLRFQKDGDLGDELKCKTNEDVLVLTTNASISPGIRKVRAFYDSDSIIVYQAFNALAASEAAKNNRFGTGYNFNRKMTWIKPSFLWMMGRVNWLRIDPEKHVLRIKLNRQFFYRLLDNATLSSMPENGYYTDEALYRREFNTRPNRVQWGPGRTITGRKRNYFRAIQVGIHKSFYREYNDNIIRIDDISEEVRQLAALIDLGINVKGRLYPEYPFPVSQNHFEKLDMGPVEEIPDHFYK